MKIFTKVFCFPLLFLTLTTTSLIAAGVPESFSKQTSMNIKGNIVVIGNTVLESPNPDSTSANNNLELFYVDIDSNASTFNSSSATVDSIQDTIHISGATITWAGLYWQGYLHSNDDDPGIDDIYDISNVNATGTSQIENILDTHTIALKKGNNSSLSISPDKVLWNAIYNYSSYVGYGYSAFADVTQELQNLNPDDTYTLANIPTRAGRTSYGDTYDGLGNYGAWALVIIYDNHNNPAEKYRNIAVFNGYVVLSKANNPSETIELSGFMTPREATNGVSSTLSFFAAEGDRYIYGDYAQLINQDGYVYELPDPPGTGSYFSSYIEGVPNRDPIIINNNGVDIHTTKVGTSEGSDRPIKINQTRASIKVGTTQDTFMPSMIAFSTELYVPQFCYDYAYKQDGIYFTEENDGTKDPRIVGDNLNDTNITVGIYIKNLIDSDIAISDMVANVLEIDTLQTTYTGGSTKLAEVGDLTAISIPDSALDVSDSHIKNIDIGTIQTNDYFYIYYDLEPKMTSIDLPINIKVDYNLTLDGTTTPYSLVLGSDIDMCSGSNFEYNPIVGIFNAVHENYYDLDLGGSSSYYNLPTQVTNREGDFKIVSMDPDNPDELKAISTIVAVEMIDVSGFHDTDPSCKEMGSTVSERVWVIFENNATSVAFDKNALEQAITNGMTNLTNSYDFYTNARKNAAFRISYNVVDSNNSMPYLAKNNNGEYSLLNWSMNWEGESCTQDMNGNPNDNDSIAGYCNLTNNNFTNADLAACMECIYGIDTRFVCSRDNFSIRPEAFMINIDDQNQSNITSQTRLTENFSGVASPTPTTINLASEYKYNIEVTATNFLDNAPSPGYQKPFNASNIDDTAQYTWESRSGVSANACNDESNKTLTIGFISGFADANTSINQVGEYRLEMIDKTWTTVDNNPEYMKHHTGDYFLGADIPDCVLDSSVVQSNDPYPTTDILNGCNISSNHTNDNANLVYNDIDVTLHPYKFDLNSITQSFGIDNNTTLNANSFIYMADTSFNNNQDENLSFHLNGSINAVGYDGVALSNFTSGCYAKPINIDINNSDTTLSDVAGNAVAYQAKLHNLDINTTLISADTIDVDETTHNTPMQIQVPTSNFTKPLNGSINTRLNLNFNRVNNIAVNPIRVNYDSYNVECTDAINDCTFSADLGTKTTKASLDIDQNITHYYGRTHAPLYRYTGPSGDGLIYYEVFCNGAGCDKTLLQDGVNSKYNDDPRWFINTQHSASLGTANAVTQKGSRANITATNTNGNNIATGNHPDSFTFTYDASLGYPYKATMQNNASRWLIYNPYNANDTTNEFNIEYDTSATDWSGVNQTDSSTSNEGASRTNRRSMW